MIDLIVRGFWFSIGACGAYITFRVARMCWRFPSAFAEAKRYAARQKRMRDAVEKSTEKLIALDREVRQRCQQG